MSREKFRTTRMIEIAASNGQKILFSGRGSSRHAVSARSQPTIISGATIAANTNANIGKIENLSNMREP